MEDVCNSQMCALYCLHSVISQPQPWHGEEGPISAAGTVFFFQLCCILAAEENDSDPQCQHNGYIFHIYVLSVKELKKKKKKARYASSPYSAGCHKRWQPIAIGYSVNGAEEKAVAGITCMMNFQEVEKMTQC